ncbi:hypothetical protein BgAZ_303030 [Babesia gibsoni]|uniref:Uncharacterized protein n=1 Tax=Babesia gibsoni TaxID=33632 RepID=A0AAD8P8T9_BABGI|nr:hypothetical protein BgAZ_303030 [Babesia gibsoni]
MTDQEPHHIANDCYEALLDLKSIFPAWSDTQENFHYHWRRILAATTKGGEIEQEALGFYTGILGPLVESKGEGIDAKEALDLVKKLDENRREKDESFETYNLEAVLAKDTSLIRPKPVIKKPPAPRRTVAEVTEPTTPSGGHAYGTRRRSRQLQATDADGDQGGKLDYSSSGLGTHLKKGFFSDYVWDFMSPSGEKTEYDDEIDKEISMEKEDEFDADDEELIKRQRRGRK